MAILDRETILGADDAQTKCVAVPEWGGDVLVGTITGKQRDNFEASMTGGKKTMANIRARMVSIAARGEDGEPLFTTKDVEQLGEKSAAALDRVFTAALKLNAFSNDDVDELAGN